MLRMFSEPNDSIENPLSSRVETTLPFCQLSDPIYSRIVGTDPTYLKYSAWEADGTPPLPLPSPSAMTVRM